MSVRLISRSPDLSRLLEEGYELEIRAGHLLIHGVPYVSPSREVAYGTLAAALTTAGDVTAPPSSHVASFIGGTPCDRDGRRLERIIINDGHVLAPGLKADHQFSSKPSEGRYSDYYELMVSYVEILSSKAQAIDPTATAKQFRPVRDEDPESVFNYIDTATSRAGLGAASEKLRVGKVAIVGLGGTGSYVLDLLAKAPIEEIHLFDGDGFLSHNAFRAPGAASLEGLRTQPQKVNYLHEIYSKMRSGIVPHAYGIDADTVAELREMDLVFICVDHGPARELIVDHLCDWDKSFIDVGLGVGEHDGSVGGLVKVTTSTPEKRDHLSERLTYGVPPDDDYRRNIQIVELNALNAALAVIKWKKLAGFYDDFEHEHTGIYEIDGNSMINEDSA